MAKRSIMRDKTESLFQEGGVASAPSAPLECLGMTFPKDEERREHFSEKLREKIHRQKGSLYDAGRFLISRTDPFT